jgi:hypothetical protein
LEHTSLLFSSSFGSHWTTYVVVWWHLRWGCLATSDYQGGSDDVVWWHQRTEEGHMRLFGSDETVWWHQTAKEVPMRLFVDIRWSRSVRWGCLVTLDGLGVSDEVVWWHRMTKEVPMSDIGQPRRVWWFVVHERYVQYSEYVLCRFSFSFEQVWQYWCYFL